MGKIRGKRWLAGAAGLLGAYAVAGFWLVPLVIKNQVPKIGQTELARQASIGAIHFNPFTLRLKAQDLRLAEADGTPLFAIGKLAVDMQWTSVVRRAWSFSEIRISAPSAHLSIAPDGKFNLAELLATLARRPHSATDDGMPRLVIERFALEHGKVVLRDRQAGYADNIAPINFALINFSTLPNQNGAHTFSADLEHGGRLRWKGNASLDPIRANGELTLQDISLPELSAYLKPYNRATVAAGKLDVSLPYRFSYSAGKLDASLTGARLALRDLALTRTGTSAPFATLSRLEVTGVGADLAHREATVSELRADGGKLTVRRDAKGEYDLAGLMVVAQMPVPARSPVANDWKLNIAQVALDQMAISATDETVRAPLTLNADRMRLHFKLSAGQTGANFKLNVADAAFSLADLTLASGAKTPFKLAQLGLNDGAFDLQARRANIGRIYAEDGQLQLTRDRKGRLTFLDLLPKFGAAGGHQASAPEPSAAPWVAEAKSVELSKFNTSVEDQGTGVKLHVQDLAVKLDGASSDLTRPVKFKAGMNVREGGAISAQGGIVPANGALEAEVRVTRLALAPVQPLLSQHVALKIAGGSLSAQGRLTTGMGGTKRAGLRYAGGFSIDGLALDETSGERFAAWKSVRADKLTASLAPDQLEIPLLRVVEPHAKLIIDDDRSFNAQRLLVRMASANAAAPAPLAVVAQATPPFPVRIQRVRLENAKLDFTDLSLRPQFSAKIYELNGLVSGLSSNRDARGQVELDGRVNDFGMARIRGGTNAFAPREDTNVNVIFKNIDMVSTSPYAMKFAGYRIAEGKMSLDLQYKVHDSRLEGTNQIVLDNLTLGERIDSPDAFQLPLRLAIAILKDSDGRIDLDLPVSGNIDDPQFSYGTVIGKALRNVVGRIVSAPFRALGSLFGGGEKLEAIDFDPGSDSLLPPEHEKLNMVAQILSKRPQLTLSVPGQYSEASDGTVFKTRAVRTEIVRRAGVKLQPGEDPGPLDLRDRAVRGALRNLYAERFGAAELDKQKKAVESVGVPAVPGSKPESVQQKLPVWQRFGKLIQGEPQVADASSFYHALEDRLVQNQPLAPDALARLGAQRASAILGALAAAGVDTVSMHAAAIKKVDSDAGKPVSLKLELLAK